MREGKKKEKRRQRREGEGKRGREERGNAQSKLQKYSLFFWFTYSFVL